MKRRRALLALGCLGFIPVIVHSQAGKRTPRVAIVMPYAKGNAEYEPLVNAFKEDLKAAGWPDASIQFDERWTTDNMSSVRSNIDGVVKSQPDVIVAVGGRVIPLIIKATSTIPIVLPSAGDPVANGYVKSMARPGGNVTGFSFFEVSIIGKMLEILKEIAPFLQRVAIVYNPDNPNTVLYRKLFGDAALRAHVDPVDTPVHSLGDIEKSLARLAATSNSGLFFPPDITIQAHAREVISLSMRQRLPAVYSDDRFVRLGGLASYGANRKELFSRSAGYVNRILRGEKAGDLPFQSPTKYELAINVATAKAIGLGLTPTLLARADELFE